MFHAICYYCIVQYKNKPLTPTTESYAELQKAYSHFNSSLFNDELPECLLTLQRQKNVYGYFSKQRFFNDEGRYVDEIAMNPSFFLICPFTEIMQTLVHEMCHLWQFHFGKPGRGNYHNKEWANKMESLGLMPSSTGQYGGKKTGDRMNDYPIVDGLFLSEVEKLASNDFLISWKDRYPDKTMIIKTMGLKPNQPLTEKEAKTLEAYGVSSLGTLFFDTSNNSNRIKFNCPSCNSNAWGKPSLNLICGDCSCSFVAIS